MCGICGVFAYKDKQIEKEKLLLMTRALSHRGPDDEGVFINNEIALGHRRLSIIDLDTGAQPIFNEDSKIVVIFNGEIYNYIELRDELINRGHIFRTKSDTEVLVHLYEDKRERMLHHLNGMFAFAIFDNNNKELFLARDRVGKKPIIYSNTKNRLYFASELKSLLISDDIKREVNTEKISAYLKWQYIPSPYTAIKNVYKLPAGHFLKCDKNGYIKIVRYWYPPDEEDYFLNYEETKERLREILLDAVKIRLRSDVELGAFLSGGVDSSIVVALIKKIAGNVKTFTIGFSESDFDESQYAEFVRRQWDTDHTTRIVSADIRSVIEKITYFYDEPFGDSSSIPTYLVSKETSNDVKVALSGDGGDELFAGYPRYKGAYFLNVLAKTPEFIRNAILKVLPPNIPTPEEYTGFMRNLYRFYRALEVVNKDERDRYIRFIIIFDEVLRNSLLLPHLRTKEDDFVERIYSQNKFKTLISRAEYADLLSYLTCDILYKVDIASMSNSLEVRCPLLDYRIIELAMKLPSNWKFRNLVSKYILKDIFSDLYPMKFYNRPKRGFALPLTHWFRTELKDIVFDCLFSKKSLERGYFNQDILRMLWEQHQSKRFDHSARLWTLVSLELWHRRYIDCNPISYRW
ncbi:MAG: asparagine synthase (glutamine-hydrolyzing) [Candidatus Hydrogenedentota bacterium]